MTLFVRETQVLHLGLKTRVMSYRHTIVLCNIYGNLRIKVVDILPNDRTNTLFSSDIYYLQLKEDGKLRGGFSYKFVVVVETVLSLVSRP